MSAVGRFPEGNAVLRFQLTGLKCYQSFNVERPPLPVCAQRMCTRSVVRFRSAPRRSRFGRRGRECVSKWARGRCELSVPVTDPNRGPALRGGGRGVAVRDRGTRPCFKYGAARPVRPAPRVASALYRYVRWTTALWGLPYRALAVNNLKKSRTSTRTASLAGRDREFTSVSTARAPRPDPSNRIRRRPPLLFYHAGPLIERIDNQIDGHRERIGIKRRRPLDE